MGKMDYSKLIDAETWAFIEKTQALYPSESATWPVEKNRRLYDQMGRLFTTGHPDGVSSRDFPIGHIPVRLYETGSASASVIYFHGGGFILGGLESHDDVCADICKATGYRVLSVDYRLAPEHKHPAAFDDSFAATRWVRNEWPEPIVLAGDSAGGNLAAAVAHSARGQIDGISGQVLIYPGLGGDIDAGSYIEHADAPMLTRDEIIYYMDVRYDGLRPKNDATAAPLLDTDFTGLPPTVIVSAQCDPLSGDGEQYRDKIVSAGGKAAWFNEDGLVHGYLRARHTVGRARASFERVTTAIAALGRGDWPY